MSRNSSFSEQLSSKRQNLKNISDRDRHFKYFNARPRVPTPHTDGVDHINVSGRAQTELGEVLWIESLLPFNHDIIGRCTSVGAAWDFLTTGCNDPGLRTMPRHTRRHIVEELRSNEYTRFTMTHGNYIFIDLLWSQINQIPRLKEELKKTTLPFDCYQLEGELMLPFRSRISRRLVESIECVRNAIHADIPPSAEEITGGKTRDEAYAQFKRNVRQSVVTQPERKNNLMNEITMSVTSRSRKRVGVEINDTKAAELKEAPLLAEHPLASPNPSPVWATAHESSGAMFKVAVDTFLSGLAPTVPANVCSETNLAEAREINASGADVGLDVAEDSPATETVEVTEVSSAEPTAITLHTGYIVANDPEAYGVGYVPTDEDLINICNHIVTDTTISGFELPSGFRTASSVNEETEAFATHVFLFGSRVTDGCQDVSIAIQPYVSGEDVGGVSLEVFSENSLDLICVEEEEVDVGGEVEATAAEPETPVSSDNAIL